MAHCSHAGQPSILPLGRQTPSKDKSPDPPEKAWTGGQLLTPPCCATWSQSLPLSGSRLPPVHEWGWPAPHSRPRSTDILPCPGPSAKLQGPREGLKPRDGVWGEVQEGPHLSPQAPSGQLHLIPLEMGLIPSFVHSAVFLGPLLCIGRPRSPGSCWALPSSGCLWEAVKSLLLSTCPSSVERGQSLHSQTGRACWGAGGRLLARCLARGGHPQIF